MRATLVAAALAAVLLAGAAAAAPAVRGGPPKAKPRNEDIPYIRCQVRGRAMPGYSEARPLAAVHCKARW